LDSQSLRAFGLDIHVFGGHLVPAAMSTVQGNCCPKASFI
jgi:hypothetical protein